RRCAGLGSAIEASWWVVVRGRRQGCADEGDGLVQGVTNVLRTAVGVGGIGSTGDGLHKAVHGDARPVIVDHVVRGQCAESLLELWRFGEALEQYVRVRFGPIPGQNP